MILPSKHLPPGRSLLGIGAEILSELEEARGPSELWERVRAGRANKPTVPPIAFDEFVLSLTFLHAISAVALKDGLITRSELQA
jgi:hypothetical protein